MSDPSSIGLPRRAWGVVFAAALLLTACDDAPVVSGLLVPPDARADAAIDRADVADAAFDGAETPDVTDAPDVLDGSDAPDVLDAPDVHDAPARCTGDGDCAGDPAGAVCDLAAGRCVQCLATRDTCPVDQHCDDAANRCMPGCRSDEGCAPVPSDDGGLGPARYCDTASHTCEACLVDAHCPSGTRCAGRTCVPGCTDDSRCASGERCCNGACVDPARNTDHCGACGRVCTIARGEAACVSGACAVARCTAPWADCDGDPANGCEVDTLATDAHCGRCGTACAPRANGTNTCVMGACVATCNAGRADCDGAADDGCEVSLADDVRHCGACGRACDLAHATAVCALGACAIARCDAGWADCDGNPSNGCEVDTTSSLAHCGRCGSACATPAGATARCAMGVCAIASCMGSRADCDGLFANGCETDLASTVSSCGACGRACSLPRATAACTAGVCAVAACDVGQADCNGDPSDGCETDLTRTVTACGACGRACSLAGATAACVGGRCAVARCDAGRADCDGDPANGCEVDLRGDVRNCGACGSVCMLAGGTNVCVAGACRVSACAVGRGDCDGNTANGCETDTTRTVTHCGACGAVCPALAHATTACVASACTLSRCDAGWLDCDGNPSNGCEVDRASDVNHCGACGMRCAPRPNTVATCASATCTWACAAGFADCDGNPANGCEVDTRTSTANCGACGTACTAPTGGSAACTAGRCVSACPSGQTNCAGVCRVLATDVTNCGACGRLCALPNATATCVAGTCSIGACATGYASCDGNAANGCETDTRTSTANCGACGTACAPPTGGTAACVASRCTSTCPTGQTLCGRACVDTLNDARNCGACGRTCAGTQACANGVCVNSGTLRITLTWDRAGDMDLHVVPPCGTELFYGRTRACGGVLEADNTTGTGPENAWWAAAPPTGAWLVCAVPFAITGSTTATVRVWRGATLLQTFTGVRATSTGNAACTRASPSFLGAFTL